ncbi:MAG: hypothetical protein EB059_02190 [Alphaproteobacteria bacterium]|nr:hypothetical protein [Alphaproteobacteria bacterium]
MYNFEIVNVNRYDGKVIPALTVSTNKDSLFAFVGRSPMQIAHLVLDGLGLLEESSKRTEPRASLEYFKISVMGVARTLGFHQPKLEAIDAAVEEYASASEQWAKASEEFSKKGPVQRFITQAWQAVQTIFHRIAPSFVQKPLETYYDVVKHHPEFQGVHTPYFKSGENVNVRTPIPDEVRAQPRNQMPHTAKEKIARILALREAGATRRTPPNPSPS